VLAVEMQAASLFAFARARAAQVGMVALVSNGVDDIGAQFNTGGHEFRVQVLDTVAKAAQAYLRPSRPGSTEGGRVV
jgi:uridine phosphorylase